ncbi:hypothetical protein DRO02_05990 [archaeon]|nr:MAG: hypothetical protein DRO02_05990 [archaeon]RLG64128.1 MAG: hypothetical protein DRO21_04625 [archaeon]
MISDSSSLSKLEKIYEALRRELSINIEDDIRAARKLSQLLKGKNIDETFKQLRESIKQKHILIIGLGKTLLQDLKSLESFLRQKLCQLTIITVEQAYPPTEETLPEGIVKGVVTDLDGVNPLEIPENVIKIVHGHGDNISLLETYIPKLENIVGTIQVDLNLGNVYRVHGFTDGDRAAYMAAQLKASTITLAAMDMGQLGISPFTFTKHTGLNRQYHWRKKMKLRYGLKLLELLPETFPGPDYYVLSNRYRIKGFKNITVKELINLASH